jgi:exopolysaccharide production protein ExoZ
MLKKCGLTKVTILLVLRKNMLSNVQVLRAIAAYLVVFVHLSELLPDNALTAFLKSKGYSGVDLFFVISGFIMVYSTSRKKISGGQFLLNRLRRIVPLYYITTFIVFAIALALPSLFQNTSPDIYSLLKSLAFMPFEKSPGRIYPLYYLGWTLNYEMFFYLLFALSLAIWYEMRIFTCAIVIVGLVFLGNRLPTSTDVLAYFYTQPIMLDFVLGMIIASYREKIVQIMHTNIALPWLILSIGVFALLVSSSVLDMTPSHYAPPTNTFGTFGIPGALIVIAAVGLDDARSRGKVWRGLEEIGDSSYSIYLTHFFLIGVLVALAHHFQLSPIAGITLALLAVPLTAVVGIITYRFLERPFMAQRAKQQPVS